MTLRRKLGLQILAMIIGLLVVSGAALWGLDSLHQDYGLALEGYEELRQVYTVGSHLSAARMLLTLPGGSATSQAVIDREIRAAGREFQKLLELHTPAPAPPAAAPGAPAPAPLDVVRQALADADAETSADPPGGSAGRPDARRDAVNLALGGIAELGAEIRESTEARQREAGAQHRRTIVNVASLSGAVLLGGVLLGLLQYRSVTRPLRRLSEGVRHLAARHFAGRVRGLEGRRDEFASLARDFNRMAEELDHLYRDLERKVQAKSRELVRSEKLAGVGFLAAGVAHEINNPLGIIAGYAEYSLSLLAGTRGSASTSRDRQGAVSNEGTLPDGRGSSRAPPDAAGAGEGPPDPAELEKNLRVICDEAFRCKQITSRLLSLARPGEGGSAGGAERRRLSLGAVAAEVASILGGLRPHRDRRLLVRAEGDNGDGCDGEGGDAADLGVMAVEGEMKQIVLNLTLNALEAAPPGGEVRIDVSRKGRWVELSVSDNGRGMSARTLEHVFEPFFTDRPEPAAAGAGEGDGGAEPAAGADDRDPEAGPRGTGLGLSITHAIVQAHGGRVEAFSDGPGRGSRFVVTLPAAPPAAGAAIAGPSAHPAGEVRP